MSRKTKYPIVYVCLSPAALATAMDIAPRIIYQAIALGHLEVRHLPGTVARRIWIGDAEKWFRTYWLKAIPRTLNKSSEEDQ
jgi:hypothetical protein